MRTLIAEAKKNKVTKKNKALYNTEEKLNKLNQTYNSATKEVVPSFNNSTFMSISELLLDYHL